MLLCHGQRALEVTLRCAAILTVTLAAGTLPAAAQTESSRSGAELYKAACAACHGADGRGTTPAVLGFDPPIPDFTECSFSTVEPDADCATGRGEIGNELLYERRLGARTQYEVVVVDSRAASKRV